jgi:hypothetical protein
VLTRLSEAARTNVLRADLTAQGITSLGSLARRGYGDGSWGGQMELFYQDQPMQLARWPNASWLQIAASPALREHIHQPGLPPVNLG